MKVAMRVLFELSQRIPTYQKEKSEAIVENTEIVSNLKSNSPLKNVRSAFHFFCFFIDVPTSQYS